MFYYAFILCTHVFIFFVSLHHVSMFLFAFLSSILKQLCFECFWFLCIANNNKLEFSWIENVPWDVDWASVQKAFLFSAVSEAMWMVLCTAILSVFLLIQLEQGQEQVICFSTSRQDAHLWDNRFLLGYLNVSKKLCCLACPHSL